jgi:hypothetical protein
MAELDNETLLQFAALCREALSSVASRSGSMFNGFPVAACGPASELVGRALKERFGVEGVYVCGVGHPALPERQTHAWLETDNVIIDVTYDQFPGTGLQGWVFPRDSAWHAQFEDIDRRDGFCMPSGWPMYPHDGYEAIRRALGAQGD